MRAKPTAAMFLGLETVFLYLPLVHACVTDLAVCDQETFQTQTYACAVSRAFVSLPKSAHPSLRYVICPTYQYACVKICFLYWEPFVSYFNSCSPSKKNIFSKCVPFFCRRENPEDCTERMPVRAALWKGRDGRSDPTTPDNKQCLNNEGLLLTTIRITR